MTEKSAEVASCTSYVASGVTDAVQAIRKSLLELLEGTDRLDGVAAGSVTAQPAGAATQVLGVYPARVARTR